MQSREAAVLIARFLVHDTTLPHSVQNTNRPPQPSCEPRQKGTHFLHSDLCASNLWGWLDGFHSCKVTNSPSPSVIQRFNKLLGFFLPKYLTSALTRIKPPVLIMSHQPISGNNTHKEAVSRVACVSSLICERNEVLQCPRKTPKA